jgi:hypothetical protein
MWISISVWMDGDDLWAMNVGSATRDVIAPPSRG